jgi:rhodanese-related sulfurtransferase
MNREALMLSVILASVAVTALRGQTTSGFKIISVQDARKMIEKDTSVVVLDVRTPSEYNSESGHLANALLIPLQEIEQRIGELAPYKGKTIIAYCRTGNRSGRAASLLSKKGFTAANMDGGIVKWNDAHYPIVMEKTK